MKNNQNIKNAVYCGIIFLSALIVLSVCLLCGCASGENTTATAEAVTEETATQPTTEEPCRLLLDSMTLEQKAGQTVVCGLEGTETDDGLKSLIQDKNIGGVILFSKNIESAEQFCQLTNSIKEISYYNYPPLIAADYEGGRVTRFPEEIADMPDAYTFSLAQDNELCFEEGELMGEQLNAFGISTGFSPVFDIWSNPDNTVIADRAYGTTAEQVGQYAVSVMKGLQSKGVIAVGKHFPGHGDTSEDSHYSLPVINKSLEELESLELLPFSEAIKNNVAGIMVGHLLCSQIDSENPASLSKAIVTDLLKNKMGFGGVVFTDDLTMEAVAGMYSSGEASVKAINAGCDMLLVCHGYDNAENAVDSIANAVKSGEIAEERLDDAVYKILRMKRDWNVNVDALSRPDIERINQSVNELIEKINSKAQSKLNADG